MALKRLLLGLFCLSVQLETENTVIPFINVGLPCKSQVVMMEMIMILLCCLFEKEKDTLLFEFVLTANLFFIHALFALFSFLNLSRLQKSLPKDQFRGVKFAMFALGDRAYGEAFCAAGRKMASRLVQLGATPLCRIGYGDDGTPDGGVFADLDEWLTDVLLPCALSQRQPPLLPSADVSSMLFDDTPRLAQPPYRVTRVNDDDVDNNNNKDLHDVGDDPYMDEFYRSLCPLTAYAYDSEGKRQQQLASPPNNTNGTGSNATNKQQPLLEIPLKGKVIVNDRITSSDWEQDVRHLRIVMSPPSSAVRHSHEVSDSGDDASTSTATPPYVAGDVAVVMPRNSAASVQRLIQMLPTSLKQMADSQIDIECLHSDATPWPKRCTLRTLLTCCADINGRPEREFLRSLSVFIDTPEGGGHEEGPQQAAKLVELSDPSGASLYADYILREKRNYADVLYDFDAVRSRSGSRSSSIGGDGQRANALTIEHLLALLPTIRPRHFSIASAPAVDALVTPAECDLLGTNNPELHNSITASSSSSSFAVELCAAVVEGNTPLGRSFRGLCSGFLSDCVPSAAARKKKDASPSSQCETINSDEIIRLWIRPGTFGRLPLSLKAAMSDQDDNNKPIESSSNNNVYAPPSLSFERPVMCIGAGTGIAPLRALLRERQAALHKSEPGSLLENRSLAVVPTTPTNAAANLDNILLFGCRKKNCDFHYGSEWQSMERSGLLCLKTAFSQDQYHKIYVQTLLLEQQHDHDVDDSDLLLVQHLVERKGALYIAGGAKMAKCVRDEIIEILGKSSVLPGGEKEAKLYLKKLQKRGLFSVEAWS
jgi:sulfite reductase alpha subunit-like flavoprotein